jgi:Protein of unknown function (DUF3014)
MAAPVDSRQTPPRVEPVLQPGVAMHAGEAPARAPATSRTGAAIVAVGLLVFIGLVAGAYRLWGLPAAEAPAQAAAPAEPAPEPAAAASVATAPVAPLHPIDAPPATAAAPPDAQAALRAGLAELLGERAVLALLQTDGFAARVAATIDNLGRAHAAPRLWPVVPAAGRFSTIDEAGATVPAPGNAARYEAFVALLAGADMRRAAALYKAHYAQFQAAYRALGYPAGHFNDRLVEVIDAVLDTPEPASPPALRLTEVKGPLQGDRPWVRYEYADPALQALPAGSRILLRLSPSQAAQVKARLREFRAQVAASPRR